MAALKQGSRVAGQQGSRTAEQQSSTATDLARQQAQQGGRAASSARQQFQHDAGSARQQAQHESGITMLAADHLICRAAGSAIQQVQHCNTFGTAAGSTQPHSRCSGSEHSHHEYPRLTNENAFNNPRSAIFLFTPQKTTLLPPPAPPAAPATHLPVSCSNPSQC